MTERIHINYYQYVDVTLVDGKIVIVNNKDIPENTLRIEDDRLFCCDKIIAEIDNSTGKITSTKEYISSLEVKNYSLFLESLEENGDYNKNRIRFNNDKNEYKDYPIELHTHFMEVLSDIEFLNVMKNLLPKELQNEPCIPVKKDGSILNKNERTKLINNTLYTNRIFDGQDEYEWVTIEEAKHNPKVLDNLRLPPDKQLHFKELSDCIENRSFIVDIIAHLNIKQSTNNYSNIDDTPANIRSTFKLKIYEAMLEKSLKVLKNQGIKYVEFSYSNLNTLKGMLMSNVKVDGITYKFLLSENRIHTKKNFKANGRGIKDIIDNETIAGFDLMGEEPKIDLFKGINNSNINNDYSWVTDVKNHLNPNMVFRSDDKVFSKYICESLYDQLKLVIINMLMSNKKRPTLRIHAGEMNYGDDSCNPGYTLVILKQIEDDLKKEVANDEEIQKILHIDDLDKFKLKDRLNIRIGHGLHFKEEFTNHRNETCNYFDLLRDFDAIVEICQSSNFSLSNITDLSKIPFEHYAAKGIPLVIGTDGEGTYLATLKQELRNAGNLEIEKYLLNCVMLVEKRITEGEELFDAKKEPVDYSNLADTNRGLNLNVTVDEYIEELPDRIDDSSFIRGLRQTSNRREYINDYFLDNNRLDFEEEEFFEDNIDEKEKIRRELFVVKNLYFENMINEVYYDINERDIIISSISAAEEALEKDEILKAASITVSIQALMGCRIKLNKVLFYLIYNNKSFTDCIKEEVYNIDKELEYKKLLEYKRRLENEKKFRDYRNNIYLNIEEEKIIEGYNNIINRNDEIREYLEKYCNNYRYGEGKELLEKYNIISKLNDEDWEIIERYINIINRNNGYSSDIQNQDKLTGGIYDDEESHRRNK